MARAEAKKIGQPTLAEQADLHELYEEAVQCVENEIEFLQDTFRELRGRDAVSFREDFCGTASASCEWVRTGAANHAVGVDIDAEVIGLDVKPTSVSVAKSLEVDLREPDSIQAAVDAVGGEVVGVDRASPERTAAGAMRIRSPRARR